MRVLLVPLLLVAGCSFLDGPEPSASNVNFTTDQTIYVADQISDGIRPKYAFSIVTRFENRSGQSIFLRRCFPDSKHPIYGVALVNTANDQGAAYNAVWACVGHDRPIEIKSGVTRIDTIRVRGPNGYPSGSRHHFGLLEGSFRLNFSAATCRSGEGCELDESLSVSNTFDVALASSG